MLRDATLNMANVLYEKLNEKYAKWNIWKCKKKIYVVLKGVHFFIIEVNIGASEVSWALPQTPRLHWHVMKGHSEEEKDLLNILKQRENRNKSLMIKTSTLAKKSLICVITWRHDNIVSLKCCSQQ